MGTNRAKFFILLCLLTTAEMNPITRGYARVKSLVNTAKQKVSNITDRIRNFKIPKIETKNLVPELRLKENKMEMKWLNFEMTAGYGNGKPNSVRNITDLPNESGRARTDSTSRSLLTIAKEKAMRLLYFGIYSADIALSPITKTFHKYFEDNNYLN